MNASCDSVDLLRKVQVNAVDFSQSMCCEQALTGRHLRDSANNTQCGVADAASQPPYCVWLQLCDSNMLHRLIIARSKLTWPIDWVVVLRPTRHNVGHFGGVSPSQSLASVWKKLNLTQQKHAFTNQKKCTTTQNYHTKTKARLSRLLRHPAWKQSGSILKGKEVSKRGDKKGKSE